MNKLMSVTGNFFLASVFVSLATKEPLFYAFAVFLFGMGIYSAIVSRDSK